MSKVLCMVWTCLTVVPETNVHSSLKDVQEEEEEEEEENLITPEFSLSKFKHIILKHLQ